MRTVREGRFEEMTIRGLAADLGIAPMSLYRHVRDKDDLLDEVVSRLLADVWRPAMPEDDWRAWTAEAADRLRQLLVSQPAALHVYLRHPVMSEPAMERMEAMLAVLRRATPDEDTAERAYAAIHTYTVGFAALESARDQESHDLDETGAGLTGRLEAYTTPAQFRTGLGYLIEGVLHSSSSGRSAQRGPAQPGPARPGPARPGPARPA